MDRTNSCAGTSVVYMAALALQQSLQPSCGGCPKILLVSCLGYQSWHITSSSLFVHEENSTVVRWILDRILVIG